MTTVLSGYQCKPKQSKCRLSKTGTLLSMPTPPPPLGGGPGIGLMIIINILMPLIMGWVCNHTMQDGNFAPLEARSLYCQTASIFLKHCVEHGLQSYLETCPFLFVHQESCLKCKALQIVLQHPWRLQLTILHNPRGLLAVIPGR